ncbi:MAG: glycoside hydrolase family 9 protein [Planctomycetota bacterium]
MASRSLCLALASAALLSLGSNVTASPGSTDPSSTRPSTAGDSDPLVSFDQPLLFSYGTWSDCARTARGSLIIRGEGVTNRGGGGMNLQADLSRFADRVVVARVKIGESNAAKELRVVLRDSEDRSATWRLPIGGLPHGRWIDVVAEGQATLAKPNSIDEDAGALDLTMLRQFQMQAGWEGPHKLDVVVSDVSLASSQRVAAYADQAQELARLRQKQDLEAVEHTPESPRVVHVGAVNRDLLEVVLQERRVEQQEYTAYVPEPGDDIRESGRRIPGWEDGELVDVFEKRELWREVDGQMKRVGLLAGGAQGPPLLLPDERLLGDALNLNLADLPQAYALSSPDAREYETATAPTAVYRKSKPNEKAMPEVGYAVEHRVYLRLPKPLAEGRRYELSFAGVNTSDATVEYVHDTKRVRSSAIHTNQAGYRPDDPHKHAFLSLWKGTGGAEVYTGLDAFEVLNARGDAVLTGPIEEVMAADGVETLKDRKNHSLTAVYAMDLSDVDQPGEYRVRVPGIGVSYPIRVADDAWRRVFRASMHGFLTQRSGVDIGPTATKYERPRSLHPEDGLPIYRSETDETDAFMRADQTWFQALVEGRTETEAPGAWGGYHDAGDFDRRGDHLWATYLHLELLDLFPEFFERLRLRLPGQESTDALPDLLNEALWNVTCFERLQHEDGGVGGGIEASAHPRKGEASWTDSLVWMAFAPDVYNSYTYAAVAARTARVAQRYDEPLSERLRDSAERAWSWAEPRVSAVKTEKQQNRARDARAAAAVELLWLTGDAAYDEAFATAHRIDEPAFKSQHGATFAYARLPSALGDKSLKRRARKRVIARADAAIAYGDGNAFGLASPNRYMPLIGPVGAFSTPEMGTQTLPHAHFLTGDERYLAAAVRACEYSLGANPENLVMTTGVGFNPVRNPLHFDSRYSGQPAPAGITVYGPFDRDSLPGFTENEEWGHIYILAGRTTPPSRSWPTTESYADVFLWPSLTEFTIKQNMGPTSYYWGYLAARGGARP